MSAFCNSIEAVYINFWRFSDLSRDISSHAFSSSPLPGSPPPPTGIIPGPIELFSHHDRKHSVQLLYYRDLADFQSFGRYHRSKRCQRFSVVPHGPPQHWHPLALSALPRRGETDSLHARFQSVLLLSHASTSSRQ